MKMTGRQALKWAFNHLCEAGFSEETARREGRELLALYWGRSGLHFILNLDEVLEPEVETAFRKAVLQRKEGMPLQYLTGTQEFMENEFKVCPGVLIPRQDTEVLVEAALARLWEDEAYKVADLGTGSGIIIATLALKRPLIKGTGVDQNPLAVSLARENIDRLGLSRRVEILAGSWFEPLKNRAPFDMIVSNPPYISSAEMKELSKDVLQEPHTALWGGEDGLDCYRYLVPAALDYLKPSGWFIVEIGWLQGQAVSELFKNAGYKDVSIYQDSGRRDRVVAGQK